MSGNDDYADLTKRLDTLMKMALAYYEAEPTPERAAAIRQFTNTTVGKMRTNINSGNCPPDWIDCGNYCVPPGTGCIS